MKSTLKVFWLLSCINLIQGWKFLDKFEAFEAPVIVKTPVPHCTTEYDNISCGHCDTKYHLSCVKTTETVCRPTSVRLCNPEPIESCSFVKEDKCMQVPIPSCQVTWHKKCTDKLVCSKTFAVTVPTHPKFEKFHPTTIVEPPHPPPPRVIVDPAPPQSPPAPEVNVDVVVDDAGTPDDDAEFINMNSQIGEQIAERRRRSLDEDYEEEETEEYETLGEIYDHEELAFADESEENHGERQKRGLGWLKNKKHPVKTCVTQKKCTNIPKKDCGIHKKETCIPFPKKKCETKMIEKCQTVQRQECGEAVNEKCTSIPQKDCKETIERRPRLVCPPAPTVRRISEPVFAREAQVYAGKAGKFDKFNNHGSQIGEQIG